MHSHLKVLTYSLFIRETQKPSDPLPSITQHLFNINQRLITSFKPMFVAMDVISRQLKF